MEQRRRALESAAALADTLAPAAAASATTGGAAALPSPSLTGADLLQAMREAMDKALAVLEQLVPTWRRRRGAAPADSATIIVTALSYDGRMLRPNPEDFLELPRSGASEVHVRPSDSDLDAHVAAITSATDGPGSRAVTPEGMLSSASPPPPSTPRPGPPAYSLRRSLLNRMGGLGALLTSVGLKEGPQRRRRGGGVPGPSAPVSQTEQGAFI